MDRVVIVCDVLQHLSAGLGSNALLITLLLLFFFIDKVTRRPDFFRDRVTTRTARNLQGASQGCLQDVFYICVLSEEFLTNKLSDSLLVCISSYISPQELYGCHLSSVDHLCGIEMKYQISTILHRSETCVEIAMMMLKNDERKMSAEKCKLRHFLLVPLLAKEYTQYRALSRLITRLLTNSSLNIKHQTRSATSI